MAIFGDDIVGSGCDGTIYEFVIVLVNVGEQMETEIGLAVNGLGMVGRA